MQGSFSPTKHTARHEAHYPTIPERRRCAASSRIRSFGASSIELYCSSAQPWIDAGGERKRFDKMPT